MDALIVLFYLFIAVLGLAVLFCFGYFFFFCCSKFSLWLEANAANLGIGFYDLLRMKFRRLESTWIVANLKLLKKGGVDVEVEQLESLVLAGGNLNKVASAAVAANKAGLNLGFDRIAAIELAGRDVIDAIESHVNPKVLVCPAKQQCEDGQAGLSAVSKDGVKLLVTARVTVKTRLDKIVGGAGEATVLARVGEGIVAAIGKAPSHRDILQSPELISKYILSKGLDNGTCFEIVSVDIADIDVSENIAARLNSERAEADKRTAQAQAAQRKANAVAAKQEMLSLTMEMNAHVEEAKSGLPMSIANAMNCNNVGSMLPVEPIAQDTMKWRMC